jgi:hypothetical protein
MSPSIGTRPLALAGFILLAIGLERLLNSFLVGVQWADHSVRLLLGLLCSGTGIVVLILATISRARQP